MGENDAPTKALISRREMRTTEAENASLRSQLERLGSDEAIERAAREAFWTDDVGGHIRGSHTWESIPEKGRENYRTMIRAALKAALALPADREGAKYE